MHKDLVRFGGLFWHKTDQTRTLERLAQQWAGGCLHSPQPSLQTRVSWELRSVPSEQGGVDRLPLE